MIFRLVARLLVFTSAILLLTACDEDYASSSYYYSETDGHSDYARPPELYQFHLIDTYGVNTEFDSQTYPALSPVVNQGHFEIFWEIHSGQDYFVELRINDLPRIDYSRLVMSEFCGPYLSCERHQYQYCDYTNSLDIVCESADGSIQSEYIGDLLHTLPDDQYLILQVCDTSLFSCEYQAIQVSME